MPRNHKNMKVVLAIFLWVVLSACTGKPTTLPPTLTPQISETSTVEIKTPTRVPTTLQRTPTITPTRWPTYTRTFTPRPSHTPATSQPPKTATENYLVWLIERSLIFHATQTQIAKFPASCGDFGLYGTSISPNGNWLAISCGDTQNQTLEIVRKDGKQWILQFKDYLADEFIENGNTPWGSLSPVDWTNDEKYLYFTSHVAIDAGGPCFYGYGVQGLYRINLDTGTVSATLPTTSSWDGYQFAFSPGGRRLAYTYNTRHPVILDLRTGEELTIETGGGAVGNLSWSPDSSELAYATCRPTQDGYGIEKSTVKIYSLETHGSRTILEVEKNFLEIELWDGNQILRITGYDWQTGQASYWFFDWDSGKLSTPIP